MSNPIYKSIDPRIDLSKTVNYIIEDGSSFVQYTVSNSVNDGTTITFSSSDPPGIDSIIDKKVYMAITFKATMTRVGAPLNEPVIGFEPLPGYAYPTDQIRALGTDAPRFLPISQCCSGLQVQINGSTSTAVLYEFIDPVMRYCATRDFNETQLSLAPATQDQYQDYGDFLLHGSARNVLGDYGENGFETNRGGYPFIYIQQNELGTGVPGNVTTAVVYFTSYEPLLISPCDFGMTNQRGFIGVETFRVTVSLDGSVINNMWTHNSNPSKGGWKLDSCVIAPAANGDTITYSNKINTTLPALYFTYLTSKIRNPIPAFNAYPYYPSQVFMYDSARTVSGGASTTYKTNAFKLDSVPKYIYFYAREANSSRTISSTDTYGFLNRISITFGNASSLLTSADPIQLYQISCKNGCRLSWAQWSRYVGSVLCIDMAQDIGLPESYAVGIRNPNLQISFEATWTNLSERAITYSVYAIPIFTGIMDISEGQSRMEQGIVTLQDYLSASDIQTIDHVETHNFYGGNFMNSIRNISKRALPKLKKFGKDAARSLPAVSRAVAPMIAPRLAPAIEEGADLISRLVGAGMSERDAYNYAYGGGPTGGALGGGRNFNGGAKLSRRQIRRALC